ncbi:MAG: hypothetical protein B6D59_00525 [Campylobacteraceae bacterium 4484_4]|nr:MAG: hypothetical protein B6D59_00525 [Campylobacteraceae bacterium 4484_4]
MARYRQIADLMPTFNTPWKLLSGTPGGSFFTLYSPLIDFDMLQTVTEIKDIQKKEKKVQN